MILLWEQENPQKSKGLDKRYFQIIFFHLKIIQNKNRLFNKSERSLCFIGYGVGSMIGQFTKGEEIVFRTCSNLEDQWFETTNINKFTTMIDKVYNMKEILLN